MSTTTQSVPQTVRSPRRLLPFAGGLALAPLVFLTGAYPLLPAALCSVLPRARRFGAAWLLGSALCLALSAAGLNPVMIVAREAALDRLEAITGARPQYSGFEAVTGNGELAFSEISGELAGGAGEFAARSFSIKLGFALLFTPEIAADGLAITLKPQAPGFADFRKRAAEGEARAFNATLTDVTLRVEGETLSAVTHAVKVTITQNGELEAIAAPDWCEITVNRQTHKLALLGPIRVGQGQAGFALQCDTHFSHPQYGRGVLSGTLGPDFAQPGLRATIDSLDIAPLWARYAQWSEFAGEAQGMIDIAGTFEKLTLRSRFSLSGLNYFHSTAMEMDRTRSFTAPQAEVSGDIEILAGRQFALVALKGHSPDCSIASDPAMNARGQISIAANGLWPDISAQVEITAKGKVEGPLEFTRTGKPLNKYQPNGIQLIELLPSLKARVKVKLEDFDVRCEVLNGKLKGELDVTLTKNPGEPFASVRVGGELPFTGSFDLCAARGDAQGSIVFTPHVPPVEAAVRGSLKGKAGEAPLEVEVTGRLRDPGLIFKKVTMRPEDLGRVIATAGLDKLGASERAAWALRLSVTFGVFAANRQNPFEAQDLGEIFFSFRAGD